MMMIKQAKLHSLEVRNNLGAGNQCLRLQLNGNRAVLCGPNGSGKTTLLSALSAETAESGTLTIHVAQNPNGGRPAVALSGTGTTPLTVTPASIAFGTVAGGHSSLNKTVMVTNFGSAAVSLSESVTGTNSADFTVDGGTCGATLAGGSAHCTYTLKFTPSIVGGESATLGVSAAGDAASPHNVSLGGTGS